MPARRPVQLGTLLATLLLASACGSSSAPEPLTAIKSEVPADLCATIPKDLRQDLIANANTDATGNPTAACSLRSTSGSTGVVQAVITWVQSDNDSTAAEILDSQCRAIDRSQFREQTGFSPAGTDRACAASSRGSGADSTTMAASSGREVVTVRFSAQPPEKVDANSRAQKMLEAVFSSLAGKS